MSHLVYRAPLLLIMLLLAGCPKTDGTAGAPAPRAAGQEQAAAPRRSITVKPEPMKEKAPKVPRVPSADPIPAAPKKKPRPASVPASIPAVPALPPASAAAPKAPAATPDAHQDADLVSLTDIDPTIVIDIQFARPENPFHFQFFKENAAYVRYATAKKIAAVQRRLMKKGLRLKIWSAYRPIPVQVKMYDIVGRNGDWVSDPYNDQSKKAHVRGVAIDCTLVDASGAELEMPTAYLEFAHADRMVADYPNLPPHVIANRDLLRAEMLNQGMSPYSKEWWHFQDNKIMQYPAIRMDDFPELHRRMLVDEMVTLGAEFEVQQAARAAKATKAAKAKASQVSSKTR